jgi:glucose-1-phosphate thymidylyltransferase
MWGIVPAAGRGSRIQPLAFSKELLPLCGPERPRAVSDYVMERLVIGGATRICVVIAPGKSDILEYYGGSVHSAALCYTVQPQPRGLCDAIFRALPVIDPGEPVMVGLPDTIWFPENGFRALPDDVLSFLLFPVENPESFDAVIADDEGRVGSIQVKQARPASNWVWGAFKMPGAVLTALNHLWRARDCADEYIGSLVNAWIERGGEARAFRAGHAYFDVGTMDGYMEAMHALSGQRRQAAL